MLWLCGNSFMPGGTANRTAARAKAVLGDVEAHDLVDALDADIGNAVVHGERLGVVPAAAFQRLAVRSEDRRHLGVGDRNRDLAAIDDAPAQPVALVGDRKETLAVGRDAQPRDAAEIAMRGFQDQPAAEYERAEARARGLARVERLDRLRADLDPLDIIGGARRLRRGRDQRERKDGQKGRAAWKDKIVQSRSPKSGVIPGRSGGRNPTPMTAAAGYFRFAPSGRPDLHRPRCYRGPGPPPDNSGM